jgi:23S rRNA (uridine2552-2'-O)-methyltransferase
MAYQRRDSYYARAKAAGYRSRAAYKLLQLSNRYHVIRPGDHVVDLGAWPGGWLQVAGELAGSHGRVVGVDVQPIDPIGPLHVSTIVGDVRDGAVEQTVRERCGGRVDVLLSDLAPKLSGVRDRDAARASELGDVALEVAQRLLAPGGRLVLKLFAGAEAGALMATARRAFQRVKLTKPEASRKESSEIYLVCQGFRANGLLREPDGRP